MDTARIAALLEPFLEHSLPQSQLDQISIYIDLLLRWNARINLTAIRHEEEIVTRHFGESFFLARHLFPASVARTLLSATADTTRQPAMASVVRTLLSATADTTRQPAIPPFPKTCHPERSRALREADGVAESKACPERSRRDPYSSERPPEVLGVPLHPPQRVLDIGSGAGFPALPLKLWAPHIHLTLIESNHKKAVFLREVARALTLTNINVLTGRAQTLAPSLTSQAEVVTLRAVERFETILPLALTFLAPKGTLALLITTPQIPQALAQTDLSWQVQIDVPKSYSRVLLIGHKA